MCEVKRMGKGNPDGANVIIASNSDVFVADTISYQNKAQCEKLGISCVALRDKNGFKRFKLILGRFKIPYEDYNGRLDKDLPEILDSLLSDD